MRRVVCGSPDYLAARGAPRTPADLSQHDALAFSLGATPEEWSFATGESLGPPTRLIVNSNGVAIAVAVAGRGLARVLSYQIAPELRAGKLQVVLAAFEPPPIPISIVYAEGRRAAAKVRAFVDFAVARLRADRSRTECRGDGRRRLAALQVPPMSEEVFPFLIRSSHSRSSPHRAISPSRSG